MSKTNTASQYFNENWKKYQEAINCNTLYHREMFAELNAFLEKHTASMSFSFMDIGCGDCSAIIPTLTGKPISKYIGIDAASDVLKLAEENFRGIHCEKEFICANMLDAISSIRSPVDIIFTSYAVHHLSTQQKIEFIKNCQSKLNENGLLIMIDGILKVKQTRSEWLAELENRIKITQSITTDELALRMQHPSADDFPDEIATFVRIATDQKWKSFEVLLERDIFALMVFTS